MLLHQIQLRIIFFCPRLGILDTFLPITCGKKETIFMLWDAKKKVWSVTYSKIIIFLTFQTFHITIIGRDMNAYNLLLHRLWILYSTVTPIQQCFTSLGTATSFNTGLWLLVSLTSMHNKNIFGPNEFLHCMWSHVTDLLDKINHKR